MSRRKDREQMIIQSVCSLRDKSDAEALQIKTKWKENFDMFVYGSQNKEKSDWQTNFSVNKLQNSIRAAQGKLVNTLVNTPDWYCIEARTDLNTRAEYLAPTMKKLLDYYLSAAKFKRHAGTFFLCSLISSGNIYVGWRDRMIQNPEYVMAKSDEERRKIQKKLAKHVANPQVDPLQNITQDQAQSELLDAIDEFMADAQGLTLDKEKIPPYVQVGGLDLIDINHEKVYWDTSVQYMEDSPWKCFEYEVNRYELNYLAKLGFFSKEKINSITSQGKDRDSVKRNIDRSRYNRTIDPPGTKDDLVKLTVYYGPLLDGDEIVQDKFYCIIANNGTLLKEGEYPYWEAPGYHTPVITAAVRQVPYRATGAGIGDDAVGLQKIYDSNWQLVCDTFRLGISGINVINTTNLIDRGQIAEGLYPGIVLESRVAPKDTFSRVEFNSNIEAQARPVQNMLENAIDQATGVNELMTGGTNPFSRTSAAETQARLSAGAENVNIIALDLEQNFIVPFLETAFARVLQFGMNEISLNPELQALLTTEEQSELAALTIQDRMDILNQWYSFKIKGFSSYNDKNSQAQRDNELLQIINSGGPLSQLINLPEFMKVYFKNRDIKDGDKLLMVENSPMQTIMNENQVLLSGHFVMPNPNDDHEMHIKMQGGLAQAPYATPEMQQHVMYHQQMLQQMQMSQQQPQGGQGGTEEPTQG